MLCLLWHLVMSSRTAPNHSITRTNSLLSNLLKSLSIFTVYTEVLCLGFNTRPLICNSSGYTPNFFKETIQLMELANSNTLLILSLRLTKMATICTEQFNGLLQSTWHVHVETNSTECWCLSFFLDSSDITIKVYFIHINLAYTYLELSYLLSKHF